MAKYNVKITVSYAGLALILGLLVLSCMGLIFLFV